MKSFAFMAAALALFALGCDIPDDGLEPPFQYTPLADRQFPPIAAQRNAVNATATAAAIPTPVPPTPTPTETPTPTPIPNIGVFNARLSQLTRDINAAESEDAIKALIEEMPIHYEMSVGVTISASFNPDHFHAINDELTARQAISFNANFNPNDPFIEAYIPYHALETVAKIHSLNVDVSEMTKPTPHYGVPYDDRPTATPTASELAEMQYMEEQDNLRKQRAKASKLDGILFQVSEDAAAPGADLHAIAAEAPFSDGDRVGAYIHYDLPDETAFLAFWERLAEIGVEFRGGNLQSSQVYIPVTALALIKDYPDVQSARVIIPPISAKPDVHIPNDPSHDDFRSRGALIAVFTGLALVCPELAAPDARLALPMIEPDYSDDALLTAWFYRHDGCYRK